MSSWLGKVAQVLLSSLLARTMCSVWPHTAVVPMAAYGSAPGYLTAGSSVVRRIADACIYLAAPLNLSSADPGVAVLCFFCSCMRRWHKALAHMFTRLSRYRHDAESVVGSMWRRCRRRHSVARRRMASSRHWRRARAACRAAHVATAAGARARAEQAEHGGCHGGHCAAAGPRPSPSQRAAAPASGTPPSTASCRSSPRTLRPPRWRAPRRTWCSSRSGPGPTACAA